MPLPKYVHLIVGVISLTVVGISDARANKQVYLCKTLSPGRDCDGWFGPPNLADYTPIADPVKELSTEELKIKASRCDYGIGDLASDNDTSMYLAMDQNSYVGLPGAVNKNIDGYDIFITKGWHKGGTYPQDSGFCHITVRVYYKGDWRGTCHV